MGINQTLGNFELHGEETNCITKEMLSVYTVCLSWEKYLQ